MGHYVQVVEAEDIDDENVDKSIAYKFIKFARPIQYAPNANGTIEEKAQAAEESSNKISFRVENRAQFVEGLHSYLDPDMVERIFQPFDLEDAKHVMLERKDVGIIKNEYHIHCDPAKVNDDFAVMVGHYEIAPKDEFGIVYKHLIVDQYNVYKSTDFDSGLIEYSPILEDIKDMIVKFRPLTVTFDQFNSVMPIQELSKFVKDNYINCSVYEETFTGNKNVKMYENLKICINEGWVHSYYDDMNKWETTRCMLQAELDALQFVNGKVIKPRIGNLGHSDLVDCLMVLAYRMLFNQTSLRRDAYLKPSMVGKEEVPTLMPHQQPSISKPSQFKSPFANPYFG
jgi:hypothetical protein